MSLRRSLKGSQLKNSCHLSSPHCVGVAQNSTEWERVGALSGKALKDSVFMGVDTLQSFPEQFPSLPIPGKISRFPEEFCFPLKQALSTLLELSPPVVFLWFHVVSMKKPVTNFTPVTGVSVLINYFSFPGGKRQLKQMRKIRFDTDFLPDETSKPGRSFSQDLFNNETSVKIRNAAKESKFIQGMATGTLDPDDYGGYMVQDAAYCFNAVEAFDHAAAQMQAQGKPEFSLLYRFANFLCFTTGSPNLH